MKGERTVGENVGCKHWPEVSSISRGTKVFKTRVSAGSSALCLMPRTRFAW